MGNSFSGAGAAGAIVESGVEAAVPRQAPAAKQPTVPESTRAPERREG